MLSIYNFAYNYYTYLIAHIPSVSGWNMYIVCVCVCIYSYTHSQGSEIRSGAPRSGFLSLTVYLCFSAMLGGVGKCLCLRRLKWDCINIFIKLFCVSVFKYRFSVCNFLYWFIIRNSFHVCCTTNSSIYQWLIWLFSTKKQPVFKIHLYMELTETCQCLKLSHHESFFSFFFIWLPLAYNIIPHLLRLRKTNKEWKYNESAFLFLFF